MPAAWVTHTASQTQTPRMVALSPTTEPLGVKNIPFSERAGSLGRILPASAGNSRAVSASQRSKSSGVQGMSEGMGPSRWRRIFVCGVNERLMAVVAHAVVIVALTEVERHVLMAHDRLLRPRVAGQTVELRQRIGSTW